jgi:hypothetical protein
MVLLGGFATAGKNPAKEIKEHPAKSGCFALTGGLWRSQRVKHGYEDSSDVDFPLC